MLRIGRIRLALDAVLVLVILVGVGTCAVRAHTPDRTTESLAVNAHKATRLALQRRRTTDSLTRLAQDAEQRVRAHASANRNLAARLSATLAANDSLLGDSLTLAPAAFTDSVVVALVRTTEVARLYRDSTDVLLGSVERLLASQSEERQAWLAEREANAAHLAAVTAQRDHYRDQATCTIGPFPCPTRTQVAALGLLWLLL